MIDRDLLPHLPVVLAVARQAGFAGAASALGLSASAVSHAVKAVENRLGEPLFARTTRSVSLTEAGRQLLPRLEAALEEIGAAVEDFGAQRGELGGVLRLNVPRVAMSLACTEILVRLAQRHPRLTVELHTNDAFVDIVAGGFDAGVRLGDAVQQDMVSVRLTPPLLAILVASPAYLTARGTPASLAELAASHNCIGYRLQGSGALYDWDLLDAEGRPVQLKTQGSAVLTDSTHARELALAGLGVAYLFEPLVRDDLRDGRLVRLLPASAVVEQGLFLYFPRRAAMAPRLRAFIDVARERLASSETAAAR